MFRILIILRKGNTETDKIYIGERGTDINSRLFKRKNLNKNSKKIPINGSIVEH